MKITVKKTKKFEIDISKKQVQEIAIKAIKRVLKLPDEDLYIMYRNNMKFLCYDEEVYTSHSFDIRREIRQATDEDEFLMNLIEKLNGYK